MKENVPKYLKFEQFPPASSKCGGWWVIYAACLFIRSVSTCVDTICDNMPTV